MDLLLAACVVASFLRITNSFNGYIRGNTRGLLRDQPNDFISKFAPNNLVEQEIETVLSRQNRAVGSFTGKSNEIISNIPMNDENETLETNEPVDNNDNDDFDDTESISSVTSFIAKAGY